MEDFRHYELVACGGTFDLFHKGHRSFLATALTISREIYIGITSDAYVASRKGHAPVEVYEERAKSVIMYLQEKGAGNRVKILPIDSVFFPKEWENVPFEAIVVTEESLQGAVKINEKRALDGREKLPIINSPLIFADDGLPISSTRIREGNIDREGKSYINASWYSKQLVLPEGLRKDLQKPFGEIIDAKTYAFSVTEKKLLLAVGDVTVTLLHGRGITPKISVVDLVVERKKRYESLSEMSLLPVNLTYTVQNTPGHISSELFDVVNEAFVYVLRGETALIHVEGEEDLAVLPLLLRAPLGWVLCYGQPRVGAVKVVISEAIKQKARVLLENFTMR